MKFDSLYEVETTIYDNLLIKPYKFSSAPNGMRFELHWHERFEILIIDEGELELRVDDKHFIATPGDIVVINPGVLHSGAAENNYTKYRALLFELETFTKYKLTKLKLDPIILHTTAFVDRIRDSKLLDIVNQIYDVWYSEEGESEFKLIGLTYFLIGRLLERHVNPHFSNPINTRDFQEVIDYISTHYCDKINTNYISKMFGYNETYLCRRFKEITGLSPMDYIKILRLEKSRSLLKHSNESINSIAIECGFADINYFSRRFKAHYKITPTEYRAQNLKLNWK